MILTAPPSHSPIPRIPEEEFWITYARSSGPGGQNVNKRETKAVARWNVEGSSVFTHEQKQQIRVALNNRINADGFLVVDADAERSQDQNRQQAIETIQRLVAEALTPVKPRIATKPSRSAKRQRVDEKVRRGAVKQGRNIKRNPMPEYD